MDAMGCHPDLTQLLTESHGQEHDKHLLDHLLSSLIIFQNWLAIAPRTMCLDTIAINRDTEAILVAIAPLAAVDAAVGPYKSALTIFQIPLIAALVQGPVGPHHFPHPTHVTALPLARIDAAVGKRIAPLPIHLVSPELPLVVNTCA